MQERARSYDAERDKDVFACAICLENFAEDPTKQVAELNCSNKHVFHVECLQGWIKNNDTCPVCREPVL